MKTVRLARSALSTPAAKALVTNLSWLVADRILRMGAGVIVFASMAKHLGPVAFGQFNYAYAIVMLFVSLSALGMNGIVVRDVVRDPEHAHATLGTAMGLQFAGGLVLAAAIAVTAIAMMPSNDTGRIIAFVLSLSATFRATDVVKYWFESQIQSKYSVWIENLVFLVMAGVRGVAILKDADVLFFAWAVVVETACTSLGLVLVYRWKTGSLRRWTFRASRAKELLQESWPLILSGIASSVYMKLDQIMLGSMAGASAVGIYTAASRISEVWYFIPMVVATSVFPKIIEAQTVGPELFTSRLQAMYNGLTILSLAIACLFSATSSAIISIAFGTEYHEAAAILRIHIWTGVFVSLGVASSSWYLANGLQMLAFYRTLCGLVLNVVANLVLIPLYGAIGAALATLLSQIFATYLFDAFNPRTRLAFRMKSDALLLGLGSAWGKR